MRPKKIKNLKALLGGEFSERELENIMKYYPEVANDSEVILNIFRQAREEKIPTLADDFIQKLLSRIKNQKSRGKKIYQAAKGKSNFSYASTLSNY